MKFVIHKADTRGHANFGWLDSHHTFSFGRYYDPDRIQFGVLRVLNDDIVIGGAGFGTHPHDNMEIISIPLQGAIEHQDSMGTKGVIQTGDVQIMSAGTGISHSEYNHSSTEELNFLQIWILPKEKNIQPRYEQKSYQLENTPNQWIPLVAPDHKEAVWINQDAYFFLAKIDEDHKLPYQIKKKGNGVYLLVIDGNITAGNQELSKRDGIGIYEVNEVEVNALDDAKVLLIEVPMEGR